MGDEIRVEIPQPHETIEEVAKVPEAITESAVDAAHDIGTLQAEHEALKAEHGALRVEHDTLRGIVDMHDNTINALPNDYAFKDHSHEEYLTKDWWDQQTTPTEDTTVEINTPTPPIVETGEDVEPGTVAVTIPSNEPPKVRFPGLFHRGT